MEALEPIANAGDWDSLIDLYRHLIEVHHWPFGPMLDFVLTVSQSPLANAFYPSSSHEHFGFSLVRDYPQRVQPPAAINSGPLSLLTKPGMPRSANSRVKAAVTARLVRDTPTVTDSHSRVNSSRMFKKRILPPEASASS